MRASRGEIKIEDILRFNGLSFIEEYSFDDLLSFNHKPLRFDFAVFDDNGDLDFLIEYQGIQHYEPVDFASKGEEWAKEQFEINHNKDILKKDFCKNNNIPLLEIPYWEFDNIENIILDFIKEAA